MIIGHCMRQDKVTDAIRLIHSLGGNAVQISLGEAHRPGVKTIDVADAQLVQRIRTLHGFYVVIHGKYLYNFCRPTDDPMVVRHRKILVQELQEAEKLHADVIIHQGKNLKELGQSKSVAHQNYTRNVTEVLRMYKGPSKIILENSARQGTECGYALDDLIDMYNMFDAEDQTRLGFCLDLCHVFVAGELDVRCPDRVSAFLRQCQRELPLCLVHFNDSDTPFNGANDNHGSIEKGYIGSKTLGGNPEGLRTAAQFCVEHSVPMILETSSSTMSADIACVKSYCS